MDTVLTVSRYLDVVNSTLKEKKARIAGEISGVQMYEGRSYLYFSIKDSKDQSTIKCFMWKQDFRLSGVTISEGLEVILTAYPSVYKPNGGLSLQVEHIELVGAGALQKAYEELKKKLEAEGLFALDRKRSIPTYPQKIGVITSKSGAVISDFLSNLGKYGFDITFVDSKVEGVDALKELSAAVDTLAKQDIDVLVLMRGGGSLESFLAFNNEVLVRKIATFPVPVLTGIGHDKDVPLVSLVSDYNVSTPTAVTAVLNNSWKEASATYRLLSQRLSTTFEDILNQKKFFVEQSALTIEHRADRLFQQVRQLEERFISAAGRTQQVIQFTYQHIGILESSIERYLQTHIALVTKKLDQTEQLLTFSDPRRQLSLGYSLVRKGGTIIKTKEEVSSGEEVAIELSSGVIQATII